ncbi:MAG: hypothetical protein O2954_10710 [bacterium]|nr:hypothetical protein [bacterium]
MDGFPEARAVTTGPKHHFFGYYDKCPWDATGRYLLGLATEFMDRSPTPEDEAEIGMVDLADNNRWVPIEKTQAWNWQQGTMLHWLPTAPDREIIYNAREGDTYVSVIRDVFSGKTRTLPLPVYALSPDGRCAVTLNFSRVHRCRPGYGYAGVVDRWAEKNHPEEDGIYWMDLETGEHRLIVSLDQIGTFQPAETAQGMQNWFNHLQFNTDGTRFLFLHRWRVGKGSQTRLFTAYPDGSDVCCVSDHEMVSHFDWRDSEHILAWARRREVGDRYFLFQDRSDAIEVLGEGLLTVDGHCSYGPDRRWVLTDTYPNRETHARTLLLYDLEENRRVDIGQFYSPPEVTGEIRCDLHPRWNRDGTQVCIDSVHEGMRQMYVMDVSEIVETEGA